MGEGDQQSLDDVINEANLLDSLLSSSSHHDHEDEGGGGIGVHSLLDTDSTTLAFSHPSTLLSNSHEFIPQEIQGTQQPQEIKGTRQPQEIQGTQQPQEIQGNRQPQEIQGNRQPQEIQEPQLTSSSNQDVVDTIEDLMAGTDSHLQVKEEEQDSKLIMVSNDVDTIEPTLLPSIQTKDQEKEQPQRLIQERLSLDGLIDDHIPHIIESEARLEIPTTNDSTVQPTSAVTPSSESSCIVIASPSTAIKGTKSKGKPKNATVKKTAVKKTLTTFCKNNAQNKKKAGKKTNSNQSSQVGSSSDQSQDTADSYSSNNISTFVVNKTAGGLIASSPTIIRPQQPQQFNMMPQQFLQLPGGQSIPLQGLQGFSNGQQMMIRPPGLQQPPVMHVIQTPNGPQFVQMSLQPQIQTIQGNGKPLTVSAPNNSVVSRVGNKQILPKPSSASSCISSPNTSTTTNASTVPNSPSVIRPSNTTLPHPQQQPQLIIGQNSQGASLIQGPNGTLVLSSQSLQGHLQGQPFLIQQNMGGIGGAPVQLTLRTQSSPQVIVSSASNNNPSMNAASVRPPISPVIQNPASQPQLLMIQTPNGPMIVQLQAPAVGPVAQNIPSSMPVMMSSSSVDLNPHFSQNNPSQQPPPQSLESQEKVNPTEVQKGKKKKSPVKEKKETKTTSKPPAVKKTGASKKSKANQGVNLADLLKESGILESSPPTSPTKTSESSQTEGVVNPNLIINQGQFVPQPQQPHPTMFMMNQGHGLPGNIVLSGLAGQQSVGQQLRFSLAPDGSLLVQQPTFVPNVIQEHVNDSSKVLDSVKDSSQPSPDSTTPTLDAVVAPAVASSSVKTALQEHLNNKASGSPKTTKKELKKTTAKKSSPKKEAEKAKVKEEPIVTPAVSSSNVEVSNSFPVTNSTTASTSLTAPSTSSDVNDKKDVKEESEVPLVQLSLNPVTSVNQSSSTIRLITTPVVSSDSGTPSVFQVGNQKFITISSPAKQNLNSSGVQMPPQNTQLIQVLRFNNTPQVQQLSQVNNNVLVTSSNTMTTTTSTPTPVKPVVEHVDPEIRKAKILKLFKQQLDADQRLVLRPDVKTPMKNPDDACKRLLRYHVFHSEIKHDLKQVDKDFESVSFDLLVKKQILFDRFQRSLLRQNCLKNETHERIMLNKLFVEDETNSLKLDKEVVAQGIPLDLPPPPKSWQTEINASIEAQVERETTCMKRKLPFFDEDLSEHFEESNKMRIPSVMSSTPALITTSITGLMTESVMNLEGNSMMDQPSSLGQQNDSDDEDEDSDEDDDTDDDESNPADDMSAYLGPNNDDQEENVDNIDTIYDEINYSNSRTGIGDLNPFTSASHVHHGLDHLTHQWNTQQNICPSWSAPRVGFTDPEAAVAVDSILTSEEEDDQGNRLSEEDYARIEAQLRGVSDCYSDGSSSGAQQPLQPQHHDSQMQSAIDSILSDIPSSSTTSGVKPYYSVDHSLSQGYGNPSHHFSHPSHLNDPALDEAVKSILS